MWPPPPPRGRATAPSLTSHPPPQPPPRPPAATPSRAPSTAPGPAGGRNMTQHDDRWWWWRDKSWSHDGAQSPPSSPCLHVQVTGVTVQTADTQTLHHRGTYKSPIKTIHAINFANRMLNYLSDELPVCSPPVSQSLSPREVATIQASFSSLRAVCWVCPGLVSLVTADLVSRAPLVPVLVLNLGGSRARQQRGVELVLADRRTGLAILRDTLDTNRWVWGLQTKISQSQGRPY